MDDPITIIIILAASSGSVEGLGRLLGLGLGLLLQGASSFHPLQGHIGVVAAAAAAAVERSSATSQLPFATPEVTARRRSRLHSTPSS